MRGLVHCEETQETWCEVGGDGKKAAHDGAVCGGCGRARKVGGSVGVSVGEGEGGCVGGADHGWAGKARQSRLPRRWRVRDIVNWDYNMR